MEERHPMLKKVDRFLEQYPNAEYGPAHVVLSDYNFEDEWLNSCMTGLEFAMQMIESGQESRPSHSIEELFATLNFLRELKATPEDERFFHDA